jgi:hypothetical protein
MPDKYSKKIDQAIAQIAAFAHMNGEEAREFIYLYLERQINGQGPEVFDDENMEGVFTNTAQELKMPITELKTMIYGMLSKQNL